METLFYGAVVFLVLLISSLVYKYYSQRYKIIRLLGKTTIQSRTKKLIKTIYIESDINYNDTELYPFMKRFDNYIKDNVNIDCDILYVTSTFKDNSLVKIDLAITVVGTDKRDREIFISFDDVMEVKPFLNSIEFNMVLATLEASTSLNKHLGDYEDWVEYINNN